MESILNFKDANQDDIIQHDFHFICGPGMTEKSAPFKQLHAACHNDGILITICTATSLAALSYEGATTAHSLFLYLVEDETDVDDQNLAGCNFNQERCDFLYEVSVIFWDEFISNDCILMEAVLHLAGNVADMLGTRRPDTRCCSNFGQMGPCRRHKNDDVGICLCWLVTTPTFSRQKKTGPSAYVETY